MSPASSTQTVFESRCPYAIPGSMSWGWASVCDCFIVEPRPVDPFGLRPQASPLDDQDDLD